MAYIQEYAATDRFSKSYIEQLEKQVELEKQVGEASRSASSFSVSLCIGIIGSFPLPLPFARPFLNFSTEAANSKQSTGVAFLDFLMYNSVE